MKEKFLLLHSYDGTPFILNVSKIGWIDPNVDNPAQSIIYLNLTRDPNSQPKSFHVNHSFEELQKMLRL